MGDEEERMFLASLPEEDRAYLEDQKGLGNRYSTILTIHQYTTHHTHYTPYSPYTILTILTILTIHHTHHTHHTHYTPYSPYSLYTILTIHHTHHTPYSPYSQKAEVAWMEKMGFEYEECDVRDFNRTFMQSMSIRVPS
jgi:hypothetical protein